MGGGLIAVEGLSLATAQPFLFPLCLETQEYFYFPIFSSFVATSDGRRPPPPIPPEATIFGGSAKSRKMLGGGGILPDTVFSSIAAPLDFHRI